MFSVRYPACFLASYFYDFLFGLCFYIVQIEAKEEARRARDEACRARELEAGVVEREAVVEVKWEETAAARRAAKQVKTQQEAGQATALPELCILIK